MISYIFVDVLHLPAFSSPVSLSLSFSLPPPATREHFVNFNFNVTLEDDRNIKDTINKSSSDVVVLLIASGKQRNDTTKNASAGHAIIHILSARFLVPISFSFSFSFPISAQRFCTPKHAFVPSMRFSNLTALSQLPISVDSSTHSVPPSSSYSRFFRSRSPISVRQH